MGNAQEGWTVEQLRAAVAAALRDPGDGTDSLARVCRACVDMLPVNGASVSVMADADHRETLYASDETASVIESLQFTLGEGPCFEAFHHRRPVLIPDLAAASHLAWPVFATEIAAHPVGAIFAFPLQIGAVTLGAMDLYRRLPGWLTPEELTTALRVVDLAALALLGAQYGRPDGEWFADLPSHRQIVHQAVGMIIAEHRIRPEHALAQLRGYSFAAGRTVESVAVDLTTRRLHPARITD